MTRAMRTAVQLSHDAFRVALGLRRAARRASTTPTRADDARTGDDERILKQKKKHFFIARLIPHHAGVGGNLADEGTPPRRSRSSCPRAFESGRVIAVPCPWSGSIARAR